VEILPSSFTVCVFPTGAGTAATSELQQTSKLQNFFKQIKNTWKKKTN